MTDTQKLKDTIKVCMFDQYGTVVDMQGGLVKIATPFLKEKGWTGNPNSFVTWWRRTHFENSMIDALLHRDHTPYREIGHRAVSQVMDRAGIKFTKDDVQGVVTLTALQRVLARPPQIRSLPPRPESLSFPTRPTITSARRAPRI